MAERQNTKNSDKQKSPVPGAPAWQERLSALRNLPPVLKIVWDSGPLVVVLGFVFRLLTALQPVALLYVSKLIIDTIVHVLQSHQPIPSRLWWLVAIEFAI